jgi:EpsI family protein
MTNTATRLFIVALLVALLSGLTYVVPAWLSPKSVEPPARDFAKMPLQFGPWRGEEVQLDPDIFIATDATFVVERRYRDDENQIVSLHTALYDDPDRGVYHSPMNCYQSAGWEKVDDTPLQLQVGEGSSIRVSLTTWKLKGERVLVMYWYQLGEYILYDRYDLGSVRWRMAGQKTWPTLVKVLLQTPATNPENEAKDRIESFAKYVYQWMNEPAPQPESGSPNQ